MEEELIILAIYINVDGMSPVDVQQVMGDIITNYEKTYEDVLTKKIKSLYFPVKNQETKVECIYPVRSVPNVESELLNLYKLLLNGQTKDDDEVKKIILDVERKLKLIKLKGV